MPGETLDVAYTKPKITEFRNIGDFSINRESMVPIDEPLFEPIPSVIRFADYEPLQIKSMVFKLRNKDSVARTVRIVQPESRLFQVSLYSMEKGNTGEDVTSISGSKVAPGLEVKYLIKFSPEAKTDYNYDLHIVTEREKFVVPIMCVGKRAMIDFPDMINFGKECPVKYVTEKPVIIRNLGDKTTKWEIILEPGFSADKKEGVLEFNRSEQIILKFYPTEKKLYESEAILKYDNMEAFIPMTGNAINGNVYLSKKLVKLGESYLRLKNQRTIEIVNKSDVKIDFEWRTFKTEAEEIQKKRAIMDHLDKEEQGQRFLMRDAAAMEDNQELLDIQDDDDSGYEEVDERTLMLTNQKKAELMLQRRYKSIKKSIEENLFLFEHDIFDIKPVTGTIWPKSEMTVTITFRPEAAMDYSTYAYCNISCSDERLPLNLEGTGLGPKAYLSTQSHNIKEVCVNEQKKVQFFIENKGDIPAEFQLQKSNTPFSKMIYFDVNSGVLEVGQKINFTMFFQSSKVGEFQEVFRWAIKDRPLKEDLTLHVRGHVRAPEFEFKDNRIEFGTVSYMFEKTQTIELENKSQVKFKFNLRIPGDSKNEKEFEISPESDEIGPGEVKKIDVKFMPHQKQPYNMVLVLDIEGVGKDMKSIPITAISEAPKVHLKESVLNYGDVFLRDPQPKFIYLVNTSDLKARYKIMPQSPETQMIGKLHTDNEEGVIMPRGVAEIKVTLTTLSIMEHVQLELGIKIIANEDKPLIVKITAKSEGPKVEVKEGLIDFGEVEVLEDSYKTLQIRNNSSIKADFYAFTKKKDSIFKPIQRHHNLEVGQTMDIEIVCNADDVGIFTDTLHLVIKEGMDKEVKLRAKGKGKTIFCKENLEKGIDFGTQHTYKHQTKEIFIENKGRRDQKLEWVRKKPDKKKEDEQKKAIMPSTKKAEEAEPTPTFSIFPETRMLPKKSGSMFQFRAVSTKKGKISETFILQSVVEGDRKPTKIHEVVVSGEFMNPKLTFDMTNIEFVYDWVKGVKPDKISQNIGITCDSVLPTKFKLIIEKPFAIYPDNFELSAYKKVTARLDFDPTYNTAKLTCSEKRQLKVKHSKHPFPEAIDVVGIFNFPNLELETHEINFGAVLNDTSKKVVMRMKNVSKMNVEYQWSFMEDEMREERDDISINEIFDIMPLNGTLEPNQVEQVEFVYYGMPKRTFNATAVCQIEGGPDEKVYLKGTSSEIDYRLEFPGSTSRNEIEFKEIPFNQWAEKSFILHNSGMVPFDFKVKMDNITRKGLITVTPSAGKIAGSGRVTIKVNFCPGLPGDYLEKFKIQVAHKEAETIYLKGYGQYPALKFELNREVDEELRKRIEDEGQILDNISIDSQTSSMTKKFPESEFISRLDRKILADSVMKNIEDRAKGILSMNTSFAQEGREDNTVAIQPPVDAKEDQPAGQNTATNLANTTTRSGFGRGTVASKFEKQLYENITVGRYYIDLGNVISGSIAQYQFRVYNVGKMPQSTIIFDQKNLRPFGFKLSTDRLTLKNKDKNYEDIKVWFATNNKKQGPTGKLSFELPVEIDNGPKYIIEIRANVTVPELDFSSKEINFDKVICGQKKIITLRISNDREVECNWSIIQKKEPKKRHNEPKTENKFTITPSIGTLGSFCKQNIEITFIPSSEKNYQSLYEVTMEDNQKKIELTFNGQGIIPNLQFMPEEMIFDPCLPYDVVYKCVEVRNNSEFDIEFYSLDFDKQHVDEEKIMVTYEPLQKSDGLNMKVRQPGESLWPEMKNYYAIFQDNQRINAEINKLKDNKEMPEDERQTKIEELEKERKVLKEDTKYPMAIEDKLRRYILVRGPKQCGKSQLCKVLSKEHQRGLVNFSEILEWNINAGTPAGVKAQEYLQKREEDKEAVLVEKEKQKKKQPKKKGQEEENLFLERFEWINDEIMADLVRERLKSKDCNAGAVFDNVWGSFFENELVALKAILAACQASVTQILNIKPTRENHGHLTCNIIDPEAIALGEKELEEQMVHQDDKKKPKVIVDRRVLQLNKKTKEMTVKEKKAAKEKNNKDNIDQAASNDENDDVHHVDPTLKHFDIEEIYQLEAEELKAYLKSTEEIRKYFEGVITDEEIHKVDLHMKKIEEEEEAKDPKKKKEAAKKASNKTSRPDTASKPVERVERESIDFGDQRVFSEIDMFYNFKQLNLVALRTVPKVEFPDPVTLPLPEPQIFQIVKKKETKKLRQKVDHFEIYTPANFIKEDVIQAILDDEFKDQVEVQKQKIIEADERIKSEIQALKEERAHFLRREAEEKARMEMQDTEKKAVEEKQSLEIEIPEIDENELDSANLKSFRDEKTKIIEEYETAYQKRRKELVSKNSVPFDKQTLQSIFRWIVPKGKSIVLVLKFFSKTTGEYQTVLDFDNIYSTGRAYHYKVKALCDFPKICTNPDKVFAVKKQFKQANLAEALQKVYFRDDDKFDFGPLLIGKRSLDKNEKKIMAVNSTTYEIINEGCYKANIHFDLASNIIEDGNYKKDIYTIHPSHMELEPGQIEKIRVWCVPDEVRVYTDDLICMIENNPQPFIVKMEATGASPVLSTSHKLIEFDRLLLDQTFTKVLTLKNIGLIPSKWKLEGLENMPVEFQITPTSGELRPTRECQIEIKFASSRQDKFSHDIRVQATDLEEIGVNQEPLPVSLKAEAFNITVKFDGFGNPENILNFGDLEVGRRVQKTFTIKNEGLYDVKFNFTMSKKLFKDNFKINPSQGEIKPGEIKEISVVFKASEEVKINPTLMKTDIMCEILEGKSSESFSKCPINVNANAVYTQVAINPMKQINFGPFKFNEEITRSFEIRNDGLFEFMYTVFDMNDEEKLKELKEEQVRIYQEMDTLIVEEKGKKPKKDDKPKKPAGGAGKKGVDLLALQIGQFNISPSYGTIPPNTAVQVDVKFKAKSNQIYENKLCIDVVNRNPANHPDGIPYELLAESCIPAINSHNFEVIFEEQIVVPTMNASGKPIQDIVNSNVFATDERCFYFGTIVPAKHPEGVKERFKIMNNGKVPAEVKFSVNPKKSGAVSADKEFPFKIVSAPNEKIPPHEYRYVTVAFTPTIMASYVGIFEAMVTNSDAPTSSTNILTFDLKGEGAMPTLKLEKPKEWINDNVPLLKFPKTRLGKRVVDAIVIRNDGVIPATVKFDVTQSPHFKFLSQSSYTLTPKSSQPFEIEYIPQAVGEGIWEFSFDTLLNPYEHTKVIVKGECFFEGITFEGLPLDKDDQLHFGDVMIDAPKKVTFFVKNQTDTDMRLALELNGSECLSIKPSIAHLVSKGTKTFHATLKSGKKLSLDAFKIFFKTEKMKQKEAKWIDWDNSRRKRKMITKTEDDWIKKCQEVEDTYKKNEAELALKGKKIPKRPENYLPQKPAIQPEERRDVEYEEPIHEPAFEFIPGGEKKVEMQVFAKVDSAKYVLDVTDINFAPTMMYSIRTFDFRMKNDSICAMHYKWEFINRNDQFNSGFYKITPQTGTIRPESEESFQVKFAPTEIEEDQTRRLTCLIPNLDPTQEPPSIMVESATERPICHFELDVSNYLSVRPGDIPEVDMAKLKVIEFESLGVKVRNKKRFYVVNPTATGYEFQWKRVDSDLGGQVNAGNFFGCEFEKGVILCGKKFEMTFEYKPEVSGLHEALWVFEIPAFNLKQYFLLVGKVTEPKVFFEVGRVNFGPLLLGGKNKETIKLKNLDHLPYHFNFNKASIKGENDYGESLEIEPLSGVVGADSDFPLNITFKPKVEGEYNYNIVCNITQKPRPLNINVKGIGYILHHSVHLNDSPSLLVPNFLNAIDFGSLYVNERKTRTITIKNTGDFNFDFMIKKGSFHYVSIVPETATVKTGSKVDIEVIFNPTKDYKLRPNLHTLVLNIVSGPSYQFKLNGSARKPTVEVSFPLHDFGPCFVMKNPIKKIVILKMRNLDNTAISIEPLFDKKNYLDVQLPPGQVLLPFDKNDPEKSIIHVPIVFTPREIRKIDEIVSFDINQLHKIDVRILGEGIPMRVELKRTEDSFIDFGIVRVGTDNSYIAGLVNHSRGEVHLSFDVGKQIEELRKLCISLPQETEFTLFPRESRDLELRFHPNLRINSFKQELKYKIMENDEIVPLLTVQGACQGMDLKLMEEVLNFGSVVVGSKLTKKLQLNNMGDMGAKFEWDTTYCKPFFTMTPKKSYIPPNDSVIFMIDFHPKVSEEHNFTLSCEIEGGAPLKLTLMGKGSSQSSESTDLAPFQTTVRTRTSAKVTIKNPVNEKLTIKANITSTSDKFSNYFQGPESIQLNPNDKADYEVTYFPLTMTVNPKAPKIKEEKHEGKLFFPLPDGSALMYNLVGKSLPPTATETSTLAMKAKTEIVHTINLKNWLKETQRFNVICDLDTKDDSIIINGANTIDVPAEGTKLYKLTLNALKQSLNKLTVTFRNPHTDEFIFYVISLNVGAPDPIETFEMNAMVRDTFKRAIQIPNLLDRPVEIKKEHIFVDNDTIILSPQSFTIPPKTVICFLS